jgi:hypothetical protein
MVRVPAGRVVERLRHGEIRGGLDRGGIPPVFGPEDLDGQRGGVGECRQRGSYARLGQYRRIDPVGEFPQLLQDVLGFPDGPGESHLGWGIPLLAYAGACEPDVVGQRQETLLGAVVQVSLQPAAFTVSGLDDPGTGGAEFLQLGEQFRLQPLVLQAEPDSGPDLAFHPGNGPGVRDGSDGALVSHQARHRAAGHSGGFRDRPAAGVDVTLCTGEPVGDPEPRIAQRHR